jgi:hypothetical protein
MNRPLIYSRPDKPLRIPVKSRNWREEFAPLEVPQAVAVDKATECHVTPPDVAARMVRYLGDQGDYLTLEPSAGTGALVRALYDSGHSKNETVMVERHNALASLLHRLGTVNHACFLEWAGERAGRVQFPRVIMNPPFSKVREHVAAALSLMGHHGHECPPVLVALVPVTFQHPRAEVLETLPPDAFTTAKVYTKIIRILGAE